VASHCEADASLRSGGQRAARGYGHAGERTGSRFTLAQRGETIHGSRMLPLAKIVRVVDGDTMWVRMRIRLHTNAPELRDAGGQEALDRLKRRFPPGKDVALRIHSTDIYGRIVAEVLAAEPQGRRRHEFL